MQVTLKMLDCFEKEANHLPKINNLQHQHSQMYSTEQAPLVEIGQTNLGQQQGSFESGQQSTNELIGYYFGSISRETAEWILRTHASHLDGAYLLRSSGPNDDFVLSLTVINNIPGPQAGPGSLDILHYRIVETEDSFVALHGQVGDEKFATIDELIDKAQGVATKPQWPILRQTLDSQILPPTYWGLTVDQVRLAILIKAKQWGFPLLATAPFQAAAQQQPDQVGLLALQQHLAASAAENANTQPATTTLNNETIRTLIYKSLHEFQPWFHGKIGREEAERRIEEAPFKDGRFLVRERDNYSYAMCISHKKTSKHYRIDVLPTGELAIQDGRKFTSLMALVSHYTIMSDGLWCALTEACPRPIQPTSSNETNRLGVENNSALDSNGSGQIKLHPTAGQANHQAAYTPSSHQHFGSLVNQNLYCVPPIGMVQNNMLPAPVNTIRTMDSIEQVSSSGAACNNANLGNTINSNSNNNNSSNNSNKSLICAHQGGVSSLKTPIKEWLQTINHKWSQLMAGKGQHQSLNSFLFGTQNPLNNHCRHSRRGHHHHSHGHHHRRRCKDANHTSHCTCSSQSRDHQQKAVPKHQLPMLTSTANVNGLSTSAQASLAPHAAIHHQSSSSSLVPLQHNGNHGMKQAALLCNGGGKNCCKIAGSNVNCQPGNLFGANNQSATANGTFGANDRPALLSYLPHNSGFTLNSQSFIGSPLFAVNQQMASDPASCVGTSSSSGSGGSSGSRLNRHPTKLGELQEEKLISPAQSISLDLHSHHESHYGSTNNNPNNNNNNNDIYNAGSQTSTAIVNDQQLTTSSSSSTGTQLLQLSHQMGKQPSFHAPQLAQQQQRQMFFGATGVRQQQACLPGQFAAFKQLPVNGHANLHSVNHAGPIVCGQHAGPAFRYTNCDEGSLPFKPCFHTRTMLPHQTADDSQLLTGSTQLAGPAAMTKFVQFQDGQCLRTHRDTRSIQLAYLSSRQAASRQPASTRQNGVYVQAPQLGANQAFAFSAPVAVKQHVQKQTQQRSSGQANISNQPRQLQTASQPNRDVDLIDCGQLDNNFDFKYDPKLIKSSSIETLCGLADDEEPFEQNKSNAELVMSLEPCWFQPIAAQDPIKVANSHLSSILSPIRPTNGAASGDEKEQNNNYQPVVDSSNGLSMSQLIDSNCLPNKGNDELDSSISGSERRLSSHLRKKHDLDELTTALLEELTASLKAQVDLKNKRAGFGLTNNMDQKSSQATAASSSLAATYHNAQQVDSLSSQQQPEKIETNPLELVNEFDSLIPGGNSNNNNR